MPTGTQVKVDIRYRHRILRRGRGLIRQPRCNHSFTSLHLYNTVAEPDFIVAGAYLKRRCAVADLRARISTRDSKARP
jgi:hypothetical protein